MLDALERVGGDVFNLIEDGQYFIIHAPRQSGKTTLLLELTKRLNAEGRYHALYCSLETLQGVPDPEKGIPFAIGAIDNALWICDLPQAAQFKSDLQLDDHANVLQVALARYCRKLDRPLVIFFDEADCLSGQTLIQFLRQLRSGYVNRSLAPFVHALALVGMRNIRDYRDEYRKPEETLGTASPFNVTQENMTLRNFTLDEIKALYGQHAADTGQAFPDDVAGLVFEQTQGQPWLVSAIARECVDKILNRDYAKPVTRETAGQAIQDIILRRDTHIDSLMARLKEARVRKVIEPMILGETLEVDALSDDYGYVRDMGLIRDERGVTAPANPIYAEVMTRTLTLNNQDDIAQRHPEYEIPRYLRGGELDMDCLLRDFQAYWRENAGIWEGRYEYKEAAPHLILMAFLQRVINGGGRIAREYAASTGRADLCLEYEGRKYPIELKIRYSEATKGEGLEQIARYMDILGAKQGWLVLFDRRKSVGWDEKIYLTHEEYKGKQVSVVGA
jgi:hypothetical protein